MSTFMPSLNIFQDITIKEQIKAFYQLGDAIVTSSGQGHRAKNRLYRPLVGLSSQQM